MDNRVLVALVYANIGVARLWDRDPEGALAAFSKASAVGGGVRRFRIADTAAMGLPTRDRDLLRGVYVTWNAEAARAEARSECLKAAKQGMAAFPGDDAIRNNYDYCLDL